MKTTHCRGLGAFLVALAVAMLAEHIGVPRWQGAVILMLIMLGLPMVVTGQRPSFW